MNLSLLTICDSSGAPSSERTRSAFGKSSLLELTVSVLTKSIVQVLKLQMIDDTCMQPGYWLKVREFVESL